MGLGSCSSDIPTVDFSLPACFTQGCFSVPPPHSPPLCIRMASQEDRSRKSGKQAAEVDANDPELKSAAYWSQYVALDTVKLQGMDGRTLTLYLPTGLEPLRLSVLELNCTSMNSLNVSRCPPPPLYHQQTSTGTPPYPTHSYSRCFAFAHLCSPHLSQPT